MQSYFGSHFLKGLLQSILFVTIMQLKPWSSWISLTLFSWKLLYFMSHLCAFHLCILLEWENNDFCLCKRAMTWKEGHSVFCNMAPIGNMKVIWAFVLHMCAFISCFFDLLNEMKPFMIIPISLYKYTQVLLT